MPKSYLKGFGATEDGANFLHPRRKASYLQQGYGGEYDADLMRLERRRSLSDALLGQAMQPSPYAPAMVPGPYGPIVGGSPWASGIDKAGSLIGAAIAGHGVDAEEKAITDRRQKEQGSFLQSLLGGGQQTAVAPSPIAPASAPMAPPVLPEGDTQKTLNQWSGEPMQPPAAPTPQVQPTPGGMSDLPTLMKGLTLGGPAAEIAKARIEQLLKPKTYKREKGIDPATGRETYGNFDETTGTFMQSGGVAAAPERKLEVSPTGEVIDPYDRSYLGRKFEKDDQVSGVPGYLRRGGKFFDSSGREVSTGEIQAAELKARAAGASRTSISNYPAPVPVLNPKTGEMEMVRFGSHGEEMVTKYQPPPKEPKEPSEGQAASKGYLDRMQAAENIMDKPELSGAQKPELKETAARKLAGETAATISMSPERQRARQAQEDWVRARLRKESGAVIPPDEMDREIRVYFPQIGETDPKVIDQKKQSRAQAIEQLRTSSGPLGREPGREVSGKVKPAGTLPKGWKVEREK